MKTAISAFEPPISSNDQGKYNTLIVEDESDDLERIKTELAKLGINDPDIATDYKTFTKLVEKSQYDAVSIDWELKRAEKGSEVLRLLKTTYPEVAKVVFTRHAEREGDAMDLGADAFLVKSDDVDLRKYSELMKKATRLGCLRHIARRITVLGSNSIPELPGGTVDVDRDSERLIRKSALRTLISSALAGEKDEALRALLVRRGWWRPLTFNVAEYIKLSWRGKIRRVLDSAEITSSEAATILEAKERVIKALLEEEGGGDVAGQNLLESLDRLLSILGYLLRLSNYDPELIHHLWRVKDFYKNSIEKPPWDEVGLSVYLGEQGQQGLSKALIWIRSH